MKVSLPYIWEMKSSLTSHTFLHRNSNWTATLVLAARRVEDSCCPCLINRWLHVEVFLFFCGKEFYNFLGEMDDSGLSRTMHLPLSLPPGAFLDCVPGCSYSCLLDLDPSVALPLSAVFICFCLIDLFLSHASLIDEIGTSLFYNPLSSWRKWQTGFQRWHHAGRSLIT